MAVVCLSVCRVPDPKPKMKGRSKLKIGRKKAHETGDPWSHLEVERSKVKVIRSCGRSDACLPITRQRKVAEIPKLERRLSVPRLTFRTSSNVKKSKVKVTMPLKTQRPYIRKGKAYYFEFGIWYTSKVTRHT